MLKKKNTKFLVNQADEEISKPLIIGKMAKRKSTHMKRDPAYDTSDSEFEVGPENFGNFDRTRSLSEDNFMPNAKKDTSS